MADIAVVVPTNRPEKFLDFFRRWVPYFTNHFVHLYVVEDSPEPTFRVPEAELYVAHLSHKDIELSFIPTRTGSIRSFGMLAAYKNKHEYIITLDDDCHPVGDSIQTFLDAFKKKYPVSGYFDIGHVFGLGEFMRGYPLHEREVAEPIIQYGGWDNVPDFDAITQMKHETNGTLENYRFERKTLAIPLGVAFTGCIMNVAMKREAVPMLYQHMMGLERLGYDRADDIWSGYFAKRICDHLKLPILVNGEASIKHTRASNTMANLEKELLAYGYNEVLWSHLAGIKFTSDNVIGCYRELADQLKPEWFGPKGQLFINSMKKWIDYVDAL